MYSVKPTSQFKKDLKLAQKRGYDMQAITAVIKKLAAGEPLWQETIKAAGNAILLLTGFWFMKFLNMNSFCILQEPALIPICSETEIPASSPSPAAPPRVAPVLVQKPLLRYNPVKRYEKQTASFVAARQPDSLF